jgi:tRNA threonylcarbamoyladenosine biosynthesis protein TsaE
MKMRFTAATEADMLALGGDLVDAIGSGDVVYLSGDLGMGKTTLVRGLLRGMGFTDRVKSPSYGLVESYAFDHPRWPSQVHHLDLYRLTDPEEMAFLGLEDLIGADRLMVVEWPERGQDLLPPATVTVAITEDAEGGRVLEYERLAAG